MFPRLSALAAAAAVTLAACGSPDETGGATAPSPTTAPTAARPTQDRDGLVATANGQLHLRCVGAGDTTVVLIAGWGDGRSSWDAIEADLRDDARVCSYDRFGTGTSDAPSVDQTFTSQAEDLAELLATSGEVGPYVAVGHSFGGAIAVAFADAHRAAVRSIVLLDATPVDWIDAACAVDDDGSEAAASFVATCEMASNPASNPERVDAAEGFRGVARIDDLGAIPVSVLFPSAVAYGDLASDAQDRLRAVKAAGMQRWASLSTSSTTTAVDGAGHYLQVDRPDVVVAAIEASLD